MSRALFLLIALSLIAPLGLALEAGGGGPSIGYVVKFEAFPSGLLPGDAFAGFPVTHVDDRLGFAVVELPSRGISEAVSRLVSHPAVRFVEVDPVVEWVSAVPDDPRWGGQYGPRQVRAPEAWDVTSGSTARSVCIVDTGVRYTHEDLRGPRWLGGYDFANGDADPWDDHGHGTHVAGTAAATSMNGRGIAGIAQAGLLGVKVIDGSGSGRSSHVASGVRWCADNGGDVISLSLGGPSGSATLRDALGYAWAKGALIVAAAGNDGPCSDCVRYPARYPEAIAVGCTTDSRARCSFSSAGVEVELSAPGSRIDAPVHTGDSAYALKSGTSMATPHVSGAAALVWSHVPSLTNAELRGILQETARDSGASGRDAEFGFGIVDAKGALDAAIALKAPPAPFNASFRTPGGNAWWVEAYVDANRPLAGVDARVDEGAWQSLELKGWGAWARSFHVPDGSLVEFRARAVAGEEVVSPAFAWPQGVPAGEPEPPAAFSPTFTVKGGNEWWVEVKVEAGEPIAGVDARAGGGDWRPLSPRSWGAWAASFHVPDGSLVEFRAVAESGGTNVSRAYVWPTGAVVDDPFTASFRTRGGNSWWVEVYVDADKALAGVDARVDGSEWRPLDAMSWGAWARSLHVPDGSLVEFRARALTGEMVVSGPHVWPSGEPAAPPGEP